MAGLMRRSGSDASSSPQARRSETATAPVLGDERSASPEPRWETLAQQQTPPPTGFGAMSIDRIASGSVRPKVQASSWRLTYCSEVASCRSCMLHW